MAKHTEHVIAFAGLRTGVARHLTAPNKGLAHLAAANNVRTDTGALVTRPGFAVLRRFTADRLGWQPLLLVSRAYPGPSPSDPTAIDRIENGGIMHQPSGSAAPEMIPDLT